MKKLKSAIIFIFIIIFCQCVNKPEEEPEPNTGTLKILLHDAPVQGNMTEVNVTLNEIRLVSSDGSDIVSVYEGPVTFNLLTLTPENPLEFINTQIPPGEYCQIRLMFAENNIVVVDDLEKPLKTPSALEWQSGFKINGCFAIEKGKQFSLTLDFDPNQSVVYNPGSDRYILKPVITILNTADLIINVYNMQANYNGEAYVAQFKTDGTVQFLNSISMKYVYKGTYTYDEMTQHVSVQYYEVDEINPDCLTCDVIATYPIDYFIIDDKFKEFDLIDYSSNTLTLKMTLTGETLSFASRQVFGAFDEF